MTKLAKAALHRALLPLGAEDWYSECKSRFGMRCSNLTWDAVQQLLQILDIHLVE